MNKIATSLIWSIIFISCLQAQQETKNYSLAEDVLWASPEGFDLSMDIYTPDRGKESYPVLVIFHGGGWLINDNSIMDQMSDYIATHGDYVVCNVNYRRLGDMDNQVTINQIVEDAMGAVLWVKEHIGKYKGDNQKIALTGDSAGGHLAAMVVNASHKLGKKPFRKGTVYFRPSYLPTDKKLRSLLSENALEVQAAVLSYGSFDMEANARGGFESPANFFWTMAGAEARPIFGSKISVAKNPEYYRGVSPIYLIPEAEDRKLPPQFLLVGSKDDLTTPTLVKAYADKLEAAGHPVTYWVHEGRPHAFLDSGSNEFLGIKFEEDAIPALEEIIRFLDGVFYGG